MTPNLSSADSETSEGASKKLKSITDFVLRIKPQSPPTQMEVIQAPAKKIPAKKGKKTVPETYTVEKIVDKRVVKGRTEYLVKWMYFPESDNTWEPKSHFQSNQMIKQFEIERANSHSDQNQVVLSESGSDMSGSAASYGDDSFMDSSTDLAMLTAKAITFVHRDPQTEKLFYTLEYEDCKLQVLLESTLAHEKYPQLVIEYLASRIRWMKPPENGRCNTSD